MVSSGRREPLSAPRQDGRRRWRRVPSVLHRKWNTHGHLRVWARHRRLARMVQRPADDCRAHARLLVRPRGHHVERTSEWRARCQDHRERAPYAPGERLRSAALRDGGAFTRRAPRASVCRRRGSRCGERRRARRLLPSRATEARARSARGRAAGDAAARACGHGRAATAGRRQWRGGPLRRHARLRAAAFASQSLPAVLCSSRGSCCNASWRRYLQIRSSGSFLVVATTSSKSSPRSWWRRCAMWWVRFGEVRFDGCRPQTRHEARVHRTKPSVTLGDVVNRQTCSKRRRVRRRGDVEGRARHRATPRTRAHHERCRLNSVGARR
jgi:hypothetical protein